MIPCKDLVSEPQSRLNLLATKTTISCKVFEDKNETLELASKPKFRSRTKHIRIKYHHFWDSMKSGTVGLLPIDTLELVADIVIKALDEQKFVYVPKKEVDWLVVTV